jgi:hypothetical protein
MMSTSFHPQTDGITERVNCSIAQIFCASISPDQQDWVYRCPLTEFAINSSINQATGMAPFELNYGYMPVVMRQLPAVEHAPPGVRTLAMNALRNMAVAHDALIAERVVQQFHADKHRCDEPDI